MTINYTILGLLESGDRSGYDLKKVMQELDFLPWSGNNNQIYKALVYLGVKAYKSGANFVFFKSDIDNLQKKLVDKDVLIRKFSGKLDGYYRVSVGTKEQNEKFLEAFKEVM